MVNTWGPASLLSYSHSYLFSSTLVLVKNERPARVSALHGSTKGPYKQSRLCRHRGEEASHLGAVSAWREATVERALPDPALKRWTERVRSRHLFVLDAIGLLLAALLALAVGLNVPLDLDLLAGTAWIVGIIVFTQLAVNIVFGLYTTSWRFASINEMWRLLACTVAGTVAAALIVTSILALDPVVVTDSLPPALWLAVTLLTLTVLAGPRFLIRSVSDIRHHTHEGTEQQRTLLYGAGWAGVMIGAVG